MSAEAMEREAGGWSGQLLRDARLRMGLTPEQAERQLFFQPGYVEALEQGDFKRLPGLLFIKGYVRAYARLLQLSPIIFLHQLQDYCSKEVNAVEIENIPVNTQVLWQQKTSNEKSFGYWRKWLLLIMVVVLMLAMLWPQVSDFLNRSLLKNVLNNVEMNVPSLSSLDFNRSSETDSDSTSVGMESVTVDTYAPQVSATTNIGSPTDDQIVSSHSDVNPFSPAEPKMLNSQPDLSSSDLSKTVTGGAVVDRIGLDRTIIDRTVIDQVANTDATVSNQNAQHDQSVILNNRDKMLVPVRVLDDGRWQIGLHVEKNIVNSGDPTTDYLQIKLKSSTSLQIVDATGETHPLKTYAKNANINVKGLAPFTLTVGDIKAIHVLFNQQEVIL